MRVESDEATLFIVVRDARGLACHGCGSLSNLRGVVRHLGLLRRLHGRRTTRDDRERQPQRAQANSADHHRPHRLSLLRSYRLQTQSPYFSADG